jgi:hypothetical protein
MNKEFIPFEISLELEELGFNEECLGYYGYNPFTYNSESSDNKISFRLEYPQHQGFTPKSTRDPLYQQAFRFFREEHGLFSAVNVDQTMEPKFCYSVSRYAENSDWAILVFNSDLYYTYEEAELALLRRLIQTVKEK